MEKHKNDIYNTKHKENYSFYTFSNDVQLYYYSVFYKIKTNYFLNPEDQHILEKFDLYQCLIMNSMFEGNDPYKYGKYLRFLNEKIFSNYGKINIICFVNNSKFTADTFFDFLNEHKLFDSESNSTTADNKIIRQNINVENYECQYLKYEHISFYTKKLENNTYINLILEKFNYNQNIML
jgi:hypothetical protein